MPRVVRTVAGDVLADLGELLVRVYDWVDLLPPDLELDPAAIGQRGRRAPSRSRSRAWSRRSVAHRRGRCRSLGRVGFVARGRGAPFAGDLARLRDEIVAVEGLLEAPRDLQTCHCDLWADNVLGTPAGSLCVIDWENCGPADPSQELGMVLFEFGGERPVRARGLYSAYVDAGGPGRIDRPGNFSMAIAQTGHIAEMDCEAWLDPASSPAERERRVPRVARVHLACAHRAP